ncbi:MAG: bifunctional folylpolyglutamate synthase/dihydrofolate synthase [Actinobacteria bacterium]|nr:bifunctional folylpolyglutamate synthase/dihydrofolate synthase [Actinomycetota bacterium]
MRFSEALAALEDRQPERMVPDLSRITAVADLMDHPERTYSTVHVTGTNGKTTTARVAASILCAHGLTTGLYTSPHLHSVTERLSLCLDPIDQEEFAEEWDRLEPFLKEVDRGGERVTYFEALTALAFLWFADKPVETAVFEVGMGGVWDATNLIASDVAVLCPVGLDHPELGGSVLKVAEEKSGIIKETSAAAVVREQRPDALRVIEARASATQTPMLLEGRDWGLGPRSLAVRGQQISVRGLHAEYDGFFVPLHGAHQASNVGAAIVAAESLLGRALDEESLREGLESLTSPGRIEVVSHDPAVVLDGAHNPDAATALAAALPEAFTWQKLHLVLGILQDKDADGVIAALAALPGIEQVYVAASRSPRALPAEVLADATWRAGLPAKAFGSIEEAVDAARDAAGPDDLVVVTGSFYTVAVAREHLAPT